MKKLHLKGIPCSPGQVSGKPLLFKPGLCSIDGNQIWLVDGKLTVELVLAAIGRAAGLIVRIGGSMAHGANVAREAGVPLISGVSGIRRIRTADLCEIDGSTGQIVAFWVSDNPSGVHRD